MYLICFQPEVIVSDISIWICSLCKEKQQINNSLEVVNSVSSTIVPKNIKLPYDVCLMIFINFNSFVALSNYENI